MSSENGTIASALSSPRSSSAPWLVAVGVIAAAGLAFALQHGVSLRPVAGSLVAEAPATAVPVPFVQSVAPLRPLVRQSGPSDFEKELAMGPAGLMTRWDADIAEASRRFHVPAEWIRVVMRQESGGRTMLDQTHPIISTAGALGIMQVMPETYREMAQQYRLGNDPFNARDNVFAGAAYLSWLHGKYGYPAMFAAYNDGPGDLEDYLQRGRPLPAETINYVQSIGRMLKDPAVQLPGAKPATLTRPDGTEISINVAQVTAIHAAIPGEYGPDVHTVIILGRLRQGVREDIATATTRLRQHGARV